MKKRLCAGALFVSAVILAACGGGGSGGGTGSVGPAAPTASPDFYLERPAASGDQFSYAGTLTTANAYSYPSPSPLPSTSTIALVTQHIIVTTSPNPFNGLTSPVDFHTVETDAYPLQSLVTTSDAWFGYVQSGNTYKLLEAGYTSADNNSPAADTFSYHYGTPQIVDEVPESGGASWTNLPGVTIQEADADGTTATRTIANDGTYTENQNQPNAQTAQIVENIDGSGTYSGTDLLRGQIASIRYSPPSPSPTGSPVITITLNFPVPSPPAATTPPIVVHATRWYPATPAFYNEEDTVTGGVTFPGTCGVPSAFGSTGNKVEQTIDRLDTILGYTEHTVTDAYDAQGYGAVCITMTDTQKTYYDYLGDQLATFVFNSSAIRISTISETLTLQANPVINPQAAFRANGSGISGQMFIAARARFEGVVARERLSRGKALRTFLKTEGSLQRAEAP